MSATPSCRLALLGILLGCAASSSLSLELKGEGAGNVKLGTAFPGVKDGRKFQTLQPRSRPFQQVPRYLIVVDKSPLEVDVIAGCVRRIETRDNRYVTHDGLRIGSQLSELKIKGDLLRVERDDEDRVRVISSRHCGISFRLANPRGRSQASMSVVPDAIVLEEFPLTTKVDSIGIYGCKCDQYCW